MKGVATFMFVVSQECWLQEVLKCFTWQLHKDATYFAPARTGSMSQSILTSSIVAGRLEKVGFPVKEGKF